MNRTTFTWVGSVLLGLALLHAGWRSLKDADKRDPDPTHYTYMSYVDRVHELESLRKEVASAKGGEITPQQYFPNLARFWKLEDAMDRARIEETPMAQAALHGVPASEIMAAQDKVAVDRLLNDYTGKRDLRGMWSKGYTDAELDRIKKDSGIDAIGPLTHDVPADPLILSAWIVVMVIGWVLTFGVCCFRTEDAGASIGWAAFDLKFWFSVFVWPYGLSKYETSVGAQFARVRRYVTAILSSSLALAAAGCAGKRIKTEPDEKQAAPSAWVIKAQASTTTWPSYVGGDGGVFHPEPVQQTSTTISLPKGFYVGVWNSIALGGRELAPNFGDEIDLSGGWNGQLGGFSINTDATHIGVTPLRRYRGDVLQLSTMLSHDLKIHGKTITPFFWVRRSTPVVGSTPVGGLFLHEGIRTSWQVGRWGGGLSAELMHDSGAFGYSPNYFLKANASIGTNINNHWRVEIPVRLYHPLSNNGDGRKTELQAGFTLSIH